MNENTRWMYSLSDLDAEELRADISACKTPDEIRCTLHEWHESVLAPELSEDLKAEYERQKSINAFAREAVANGNYDDF